MKSNKIIIISVLVAIILLIAALSAFLVLIGYEAEEDEEVDKLFIPKGANLIEEKWSFSKPIVEEKNGYSFVRLNETTLFSKGDGRPVLPYLISTYDFELGTKIVDVVFSHNEPISSPISNMISYSSCSTITEEDENIYNNPEMFPSSFVSYTTGGGLVDDEIRTILNVRINPVTYFPTEYRVESIQDLEINIIFKEPKTPIFSDCSEKDLLIIAPQAFENSLSELVSFKEDNGIKTKLVTVEEIYGSTTGRDEAEKIKYYIKNSIEQLGIKYVLLIGGRQGQSENWYVPVRYSHVLIREGTQEDPEPSFLSDLYFADIYDSEGNFSSWDTNMNKIYAEYQNKVIDEMDLYPDVRLGRLPCRNKVQLSFVIDKIINYEKTDPGNWFKNIILISGDHWPDEDQINEGVLIMDKAKEIMSDFEPVELYTTLDGTFTTRDINKAFNKGAGFAYFCGHGSPSAWGIHLPPDATGWAPTLGPFGYIKFYNQMNMFFLRNKNKYPVTLVGGCNNGQFDIRDASFTNCWAWELTSLKNRGSIATIANTALGTHALGDSDFNGVNDYLEIYDGWLELRFFKLYQNDDLRVLGKVHQTAISDYLNMFISNNDEMDTKMVQQWELFGDPSLEIK